MAPGSRLQLCSSATRAGSKGCLSSGDGGCRNLQLPGSLQGGLEGWQGGCSCSTLQLLRGGCLALCQLPTSLSCLPCQAQQSGLLTQLCSRQTWPVRC